MGEVDEYRDESQQQTPSSSKKSNAPPEVITLNDPIKDGCPSDSTPNKGDTVSQARTPKHANKQNIKHEDESSVNANNDVEQVNISSQHSHHQRIGPSSSHSGGSGGSWSGPPPPVYQSSSYPPPPSQHFDHSRNSGGAFQPAHDRHSYSSQGHAPMHVSPGGGRYYYGNGPPNRYNNGPMVYEQRYAADFPPVQNYPQHRGGGGYGPPPLYPQQQHYAGGVNGYESGRPPATWGPPPSFPHGRPPVLHHQPEQHHYSSRGGSASHHMMNNERSNSNFSRAVSSSFDRSIKSTPEKSNHSVSIDRSPKFNSTMPPRPPQDSGSVSEDASWGALKQVHSVDEEELRKRLSKRKDREKDVIVNQPTSNSSSLTNSPTEGVEGKEKRPPRAGIKSSLDSLSSAASAQEPIMSKQQSKAPSPDDSAPSLDLMKCPSGSSALLLPSHHRSLSQLSIGLMSKTNTTRDEFDDERDSAEQSDEQQKTSSDGREPKKARTEGSEKKSSPLSITCSPPPSPGGGKKKSKMHQPQALYPQRKIADESNQAFYDKAPSYTYSIESVPAMSRDVHPESYPMTTRPGSSASSTITPMNVDGSDMRQAPPGVGQIPSWEIHGQDSFGATSANGGNPIVGSFSFQQEYQMLAPSASAEGPPMHMPPHHHQHHPGMHPQQALESRNQSFEGGHYHGGFSRSDSMISYEGHPVAYDSHGRPAYQGNFPPHAPSWGSSGSYPAGYHPQQRMGGGGYPPMMRNYSEDSGARTSPPPPANMRMMPMIPNFPPPPDFRAPPSMVNKGGPQNTILTSSYPPSPKSGPFGWSKEEDSRLTDIMKKYKNPRDWEPIAKEHNRGRSAKECHERWIRYLKPGVRKGQWTDHEDAVVMEVVTTSTEQPFTRWSDLAQRLPGRVGKQIRDRWVNHLNPAINHLPFSREDDLNLWEGHQQLGKRWVEISTKNFNNTRSENHIKNRWYSASFKKFISNEFGPDAYNGGKSSVSENDSVGGSINDNGSPTKKVDSPTNRKKPAVRTLSGGSNSRMSQQQQMDPSQMEAI